jgi:hypothetical protein
LLIEPNTRGVIAGVECARDCPDEKSRFPKGNGHEMNAKTAATHSLPAGWLGHLKSS